MSLQHLILGILSYKPLSGYDLNKAFQVSVKHFWDTEQSVIYRALYKMQEQGWVASEVVNQDTAPAKKLYRLTDAGQQALKEWLVTPGADITFHEAWLGQLFFAGALDAAEIQGLLKARIAQLQAILDKYENEVPQAAAHYADEFNAQQDARFWLLTLQYGIERMRFELRWAETTLKMFQTP